MLNFLALLLFFTAFLLTNKSDARYGAPCSSSNDCANSTQSCADGRCVCGDVKVLTYTAAGESACRHRPTSFGYCYELKNVPTRGRCEKGQKCVENGCQCDDNLFRIRRTCSMRIFVQPLEKCYFREHKSVVMACDNFGDNAFCYRGTCVCYSNYFYNFTSSLCEDKKKYTDFHNISDYRALPNGYCVSDKDCVEGLECRVHDHRCACPRECSYREENLACDCGPVEVEAPVAAILTGVIIGSHSACFWFCCVKNTILKRKEKSEPLDTGEMRPLGGVTRS